MKVQLLELTPELNVIFFVQLLEKGHVGTAISPLFQGSVFFLGQKEIKGSTEEPYMGVLQ